MPRYNADGRQRAPAAQAVRACSESVAAPSFLPCIFHVVDESGGKPANSCHKVSLCTKSDTDREN